MIDVIITSYNEPKSTLRAVNSFLKQNVEDMRIIVCDPFQEVRDFLKQNIKDKRVGFFLDPGEGKSYALNLLFSKLWSENKNDIIILTDGDVYVSENSVSSIISAFKDEKVGCITGKPVSVDSKETKYGYWASVVFTGIDKVRKKLSTEQKFFECSGYLFAIRNNVVREFPLESSEDSIIPFLFWKKGYKIKYVPEAEVYVKNPSNWKDFLGQKVRNIKAHENLNKIAPDMPRTKSLWNEIKYGFFHVLFSPRSFKQVGWMFQLYFARLYLYLKAFKEMKKQKDYSDGWREKETPSTRTLD